MQLCAHSPNNNVEQLKQSLYDTQIYPTAGSTQLQFFSLQLGSGLSSQPGWANKVKSKADTNMSGSGALPAGQAFIIESIEVDFKPGSDATANTFALQSPVVWAAVAAATLTAGIDDVNAFYNTGWLELSIMSKTYLTEGPLGRFPPKTHREINAAVATNSATTSEALLAQNNAVGRPYFFDVPLPIDENQNFAVTLNWPAVVATPSGKNGQVKVVLDGQLFRKSQ